MNLRGFSALSFDCYGTLIDWEAGICAELSPWAAGAGVRTTDEALLAAFADYEHAVQAEAPGRPYPDVLSAVIDRIGQRFGATVSEDQRGAFAASVGRWPPFPDTTEALRYLKRHFKLIILSNIDRASFAATNIALGVEFDAVLTAQDIGSYKPDRRNFECLIERASELGVPREQLLHVAQSLYHDLVPARAIGLRTVWVDRRHGRAGGATPAAGPEARWDLRVRSLAELAALHAAAILK